MTSVALGALAAVVGCAEAVVLGGFDIALLRSLRRRRREKAIASAVPEIRAVLVDFLAGADKVKELRGFLNQDPAALTEALLSFRGAVAGGARERLCQLALELGLVRDWCTEARSPSLVIRREALARLAFVSAYEPCRRLSGELQIAAIEDPDDDIRISAARGLIQTGENETLEIVFEFALSSNPLTRAVLAEELRRYAAELSEQAIPAALASGDSGVVLAALEILSAWQRAVILPDLPRLLCHNDTRVRLHALRLAPLVPLTPETRSAILVALTESDPEVSGAAALAAGRLRIEECLPHLAAMVREAGVEISRSAANALAGMPPQGWKLLEELSGSGNPLAVETATEALKKMRGTLA